jgi:ubiquinone biosynthesis monooxygenase Coq7
MNKQTERPPRLPGDLTPEIETERAIRVDHAGEYGAVRIYEGQLAVLGHAPSAGQIRHMAEQERGHLATFEALLAERKVRPTVLSPLWHAAGFAMGAGTALLGEKSAMACTVAVEEVIDRHYGRQIHRLRGVEPELCETLAKCQAEEVEHRNLALEAGAEEAPGYALLSAAVKTATRTAIWLSERI